MMVSAIYTFLKKKDCYNACRMEKYSYICRAKHSIFRLNVRNSRDRRSAV